MLNLMRRIFFQQISLSLPFIMVTARYWTTISTLLVVVLVVKVNTLPSKHKLPFEEDFDSEYDYISEDSNYLSLQEIQNAVAKLKVSHIPLASNSVREAVSYKKIVLPDVVKRDILDIQRVKRQENSGVKSTPESIETSPIPTTNNCPPDESNKNSQDMSQCNRRTTSSEAEHRENSAEMSSTSSTTRKTTTTEADPSEMSSTTRRATTKTTTTETNPSEKSAEMSLTTRRTTSKITEADPSENLSEMSSTTRRSNCRHGSRGDSQNMMLCTRRTTEKPSSSDESNESRSSSKEKKQKCRKRNQSHERHRSRHRSNERKRHSGSRERKTHRHRSHNRSNERKHHGSRERFRCD